MEQERRFFTNTFKVEKRANDDGTESTVIRGYASVFDSLSENLGGFRETIEKGAFSDVLDNDVRALFNHDANLILGRTTSGTLKIGEDDKGLNYEIDPPDTQVARDLLVSMERGDVTQSSFAFTVEDDDWNEDDEGRIIRTIRKVSRLFDVSPVTYPAYPDATVGLRGLDLFNQHKTDEQTESSVDLESKKRHLKLMNLER